MAEGLCSPIRQLEKAVVRLQQDMTDHRTELRLRTQTPDSGLQTDSGLRTPDSGLRRDVEDFLFSQEEGSFMLKYGRPYDRYTIEGLCSLIRQLEKTVVRLQQDIVDYRAELKIGTHTPTPEVPAVEQLLQRLVSGTPEVHAVVTPEVPVVEKLLQRPVTDTQSRPVPTNGHDTV